MITQDNLCLQRAVSYIVHRNNRDKPYVFFDVGANVGDYIELISSMVKANVEIHSFEPNPNAFQKLLSRYKDQQNVKLNNFGVSSFDRTMKLYDPGSQGSAIASLYNRKAYDGFKEEDKPIPVEVKLIALDSYIQNNNIEQINYMKIDVEGHELEALNGTKSAFTKGIVNAGQFEIGDTFKDAGITIEDFVEWFDNVGYTIFFPIISNNTIVRKTSDVQTIDNWENLIFINNKLLRSL